MKTKSLLRSVMMMAVLTLGSTFFTAGSAEASSKKAQSVSYTQAVNYLQTCSHHHSVNSIQAISGTNNYRATIDGNGIATVYVTNGIITGHSDAPAACIINHDQSGG